MLAAFCRPACAEGASESVPPQLDVRFQNGVEIFAPQTPINLELHTQTATAGLTLGENLGLHVTVIPVSDGEQTQQPQTEMNLQIPVQGGDHQPIPLALLAPAQEGVYELTVTLTIPETASARPGPTLWRLPGSSPRKSEPLAAKTVQFVVFDSAAPSQPVGDWLALKKEVPQATPTEWANKHWPQQLPTLPTIPSLSKIGSLSSPFKSGKLGEISRLGGFRARPQADFVDTVAAESAAPISPEPLIPPGLLEELQEQWELAQTTKATPIFGSKNLQQEPFKKEGFVFGISKLTPPKDEAPASPEPEYLKLPPSESPTSPQTWQAFPLSVQNVGQPHVVEFDYPQDQPQELGVAVVDMVEMRLAFELAQHSAGMPPAVSSGIAKPIRTDRLPPLETSGRQALNPAGLKGGDSGLYFQHTANAYNTPVPTPAVTAGSGLRVPDKQFFETKKQGQGTHRILFWPRTKNPVLMFVNRSAKHEARFGKARIFLLETETKRLPKPFDDVVEHRIGQRSVVATVRDSNFLKHIAPSGGFGDKPVFLADWYEAFTGVERFVDLLHQQGYEGVMLTTVSKKAVLYPSEHFVVSPKSPGQPADGATKDVLEILLRQCDREQIAFTPAIDFNLPLKILEDKTVTDISLAETIHADASGDNIRYNILHPLVQEAMVEAVRELVQRCAAHVSFQGVGVCLSPEGYAQLPPLVRSVDDGTFQAFQQDLPSDSGVQIPAELNVVSNIEPQQKEYLKAARARFLQSDSKTWDAWVTWRTKNMRDFYGRLAETVSAAKPGAKLYLAGATMLDHPDLQQYCTPSLLGQPSLFHILRMTGFDLSLLREIPMLSFLKPSRIGRESIQDRYEPFDSPEWIGHFVRNGNVPGVEVFQDAATDDDVTAMASSTETQRRRRFTRQLAQADVLHFFDGGESVSQRLDESLLDFIAAFRRLPPIPFQNYTPMQAGYTTDTETSLQPLTVRYARHAGKLYVYLVNAAPFGMEATLRFSHAACAPKELSGRKMISSLTLQNQTAKGFWRVSLDGYDFLALELDDPAVMLQGVAVHLPREIVGPDGYLKQQVDLLGQRIRAAQQGIVWDKLANADFEAPVTKINTIADWQVSDPSVVEAKMDSAIRFAGQNSLKISAREEAARTPGVIWSRAFDAPDTGRLFVSLQMGIPDTVTNIPLHVVLAGQNGWSRSFAAGPQGTSQASAPSSGTGVRWQRLILPFDRLPNSGNEKWNLGFQVTGPGTAWIDDVTLYHVSFTPNEIKTLQRLALAAGARCSQNRVSDLLTILEGHWAQLLHDNVPVADFDSTPRAAMAAVQQPYAGNAANTITQKDLAPKPATTAMKAASPSLFDRVKGFFGR